MKAFCAKNCLAGGNPCFWLNLAKQGKFKEAWLEIMKLNPLPTVTGKVCPHPCEDACKRVLLDEPISISTLERYLGLVAIANNWRPTVLAAKAKPFYVAVVGSGPAGLSCAYQLAIRGYSVGLFESLPVLGGMLRVGIPDFRLPRSFLDHEIDNIIWCGIGVHQNMTVDSRLFEYILHNYNAVFFATGLQKSRKLNIPGEEDNPNVLYGLDFLKSVNLGKDVNLGKEVMVIGGGNTAIDVARTAQRLGSRVSIFYRRTKSEMPAIESEILQAEKEGIEIIELVVPVGICWKTIAFQKTKMGELDESGRRKFMPVEGSDFGGVFDNLIIAAGEEKDASLSFVENNERLNIFTVGDSGTVAEAIKLGREAAGKIIQALEPENQENRLILPEDSDFYLTPKNKVDISSLVSVEEEAKRCLGCGFETENLAKVSIDKERCKGCGLCCEVCPYSVLELASSFNKQGYLPAISKNPTKCRGCTWCTLICPDVAIEIRRC